MLVTFNTITDVVAYVDETVPGHELSDDQIRDIFHATDSDYGVPMESDDPRLDALCEAVTAAAIAA